jgi:hypothetical protein
VKRKSACDGAWTLSLTPTVGLNRSEHRIAPVQFGSSGSQSEPRLVIVIALDREHLSIDV